MIYRHKDLKNQGLSNYQIKKKVEKKELFMIQKGVYSDTHESKNLDIILSKHSDCVMTLDSALYYYGLIKKEPKYFYLATKQKARKINNDLIKQTFMTDSLLFLGNNKIKYNGHVILSFDLERLLIEVVRNKPKMDYDIYQESMRSFYKLKKILNIKKLNDYVSKFNDKKIIERINNDLLKKES